MRPLLVYAAAAVAFTWPLALQPASLLGAPVGPGDPYLNLWILGWGMQAWLSDPLSVLSGRAFDANIFHPAAGTLAYSDHMLLQSGALAPLYALTGSAVVCYNALLLASLVLSALAMHLFVSRVVGTTGGAYLAGLAWGFGSYRFAHLLHLQLQALYFLPLTFLWLHRLIAARRKRDAVGLGVLTGLQAIASVYYAVIGGVGLVLAGVTLASLSSRRGAKRVLARLALAAIVAAVIALPVGLVYWRVQQAEGFGRNLFQAGQNAGRIDSYVQAPPGNIVYGRTGLLPQSSPERELFPGFALIALGIAGAWLGWRADTRPLVASMGLLVIAGFVLSLGPDGVRGLYATLHRYVFGFQAIRAPARFSVLVTFGLATLAALAYRELSSHAHRTLAPLHPRTVAPALAVLVALELAHFPVAYAAAPPERTSIGQWLRQAPGAGAIAVLPMALDIESTPAMVQSLEHRRPLLNGYSGQRPGFYASLVDTVSTFPEGESLLALHESGVQYIVTASPVARPADAGSDWPLIPRAQFAEGVIYELAWSPEIEARLSRLTTVVPPPPGPVPFAAGEEARYSVRWDSGAMNLVAGEIVLRVEGSGQTLEATATTAPWVARFFEAQDRFTTTVNAGLLPLVHERELNEGSRHVRRRYEYDWDAGLVRTGDVSLPLAAGARDSLAALYFVRTLPLVSGDVVRFPVNEAGRNQVVEVLVAARETVLVGGEARAAIRLEPRVRQRVERRTPATVTLWMSDDARRVPLIAHVEAGFGRVRLELDRYQP